MVLLMTTKKELKSYDNFFGEIPHVLNNDDD